MTNIEVPFLGYRVFCGTLEKLPPSKKLIINTINQYSFCIAEKDEEFKDALMDSDILLPDGVGVVAGVNFLSGKRLKKIAGAELFSHVAQDRNVWGGRCCALCSTGAPLEECQVLT